jgi:cell fate regulator YaaT (PSP1 superfamily)
MDMARDQGMSSKGAAKISGNCGRLMCCLRYEEEYYIEMIKNMPKVGDNFKTDKGIGRVLETNFITGKVQVELADKTKMEVEVK